MNADLLCPDIVQLLTWAVHYPAEVERGLQTVEHPESLFGNDATVTALAGLLARAPVTDVSRVLLPASSLAGCWFNKVESHPAESRGLLQ